MTNVIRLPSLREPRDRLGRHGDRLGPPVEHAVQVEEEGVVRVRDHASSRESLERPFVVGHARTKGDGELAWPALDRWPVRSHASPRAKCA